MTYIESYAKYADRTERQRATQKKRAQKRIARDVMQAKLRLEQAMAEYVECNQQGFNVLEFHTVEWLAKACDATRYTQERITANQTATEQAS